ncbi:MAG: reverse transcriptase domain-containing protein [Candidatus Staskawiczbacteria bacterium]|nr:reverse transcriptase domain-containing protein [Candidatus Staskawiczbacteria bacterium]
MNQLLYDLFRAYYDARKNKRSTINALAFEIDYETKLFELYNELISEKYEISPSICFISFKPTKREIFAADFRDRIVHHLIYNYISPFFERLFINDAYSCRKNKGTSYGIKRLNHFIRSCSENYKKDCYILKLDIKGYFMAIDHNILYQKVENTINRFRKEASFDVDFILRLIHKIIFHNHIKNCKIKGKREDWQGLPKSKSLFYAKKDKGLPIGNLTSQLFGNVYLNEFDHFVKYKLACKYYGRYVDDIAVVNKNKEYLKSIILVIKNYLEKELFLEMHPNKIYLQHFSKGVAFLGTIIKPRRIYIRNRTKGNFYKKINYWNKLFSEKGGKLEKEDTLKFLASMNSYLGMLKQFNTHKLRKSILTKGLGGGGLKVNFFRLAEQINYPITKK